MNDGPKIKKPHEKGANLEVSAEEMTETLNSIIGSDAFANSPRLHEFLRYIVSEVIAGRSHLIRAKTVAADVYHRDGLDKENAVTIVRVEAGRLRRLLSDYYEAEGRADPVRLHIDTGGYVPRFEHTDAVSKRLALTNEKRGFGQLSMSRMTLLAGTGLGLALAAFILLGRLETNDSAVNDDKSPRLAQREALMDESPAALEAENMAAQARGLLYPIFDAERQRLTAEIFRAALNVDANAVGARAGIAQSLATLALIEIEGEQHDAYLEEAQIMLDRAMELDPTDPWVQSTAGWVSFVERDFQNAIDYSERALELAPMDGNVLDFYGVVMLFSGEPEKAARAANPDRDRVGPNIRFANRNIFGGAQFHLGNYAAAARSFDQNNRTGGPVSPPGIAYLAASYHALGRLHEGRRLVDRLNDDYPGFDVAEMYLRLYSQEEDANKVIDRLRDLGLNSAEAQ